MPRSSARPAGCMLLLALLSVLAHVHHVSGIECKQGCQGTCSETTLSKSLSDVQCPDAPDVCVTYSFPDEPGTTTERFCADPGFCGDIARMKAILIAYADDSDVDAWMAKVTCNECGSNYCNAASGFRAGPLTAVLASVVMLLTIRH